MTTNYPGSIDSFTNPSSTDTLATVPHAEQHTNLNLAVIAIQTKLGTTSTKASFPAGITIPLTPTATTDAVSKSYVDAAITGMNIHESCEAATTASLSATYADGVTIDATGGYGPGATLTNTGSLAALVLDTYTLAQYDRVLIKNQSDSRQNGIYTITTLGSGSVAWVLTRSADYDNGSAVEVNAGDLIYVIHGTQSGAYVQSNEGSYSGVPQGGIIIKAGTGDNITFTQVSGINVTATTATNLSGTTQYSIPYQSASATTGYLSIGTANQLLAVNSGATGYTWTNASSLTVSSATSATNATNVANTTTSSASTFYINFGATNTTTSQGTNTNASLTYVPSTGTLSASVISGGALGGSLLSSTSGSALGTASQGTSTTPARADHVHPTTGLVTTFAGGTTGLTPASATSGAISLAGTLVVANGGTGTGTAGIAAFNNITGYSATGATGTTSTNLVFSGSPTLSGTLTISGATFNTGGITYIYQPTITTVSASGANTLTIAQLLTEIINYTGTAISTFTLPTGTLMDGGITGIVSNVAFDWSIVNTVAFAITMAAGTAHTYVGNTTIAANVSARFRSVRTGATTWVTYRLS